MECIEEAGGGLAPMVDSARFPTRSFLAYLFFTVRRRYCVTANDLAARTT